MEYIIHIGIYFAIFAIAGLSLNLLAGYTGLFSITHASFYGIGAYTTALLLTGLGINFFLTVIAGVVIAMAVSTLIGMVMSRFNDDYYAIVSLGFSAIIFALLLNWNELTRGGQGVFGIKRPALFDFVLLKNMNFLVLALILLTIIFFLCRFLVNSSFGRALTAIREDEKALESLGYNTTYFKLAVFIIGSMMAAVAGSLYASYIGYIDPSVSGINESIFMFVIIILGGPGNLYGPLIGALILILLPEAVRFIGFPVIVAAKVQEFIYGTALTILMIFRPQGLIGRYKL